MITVPLQQEDLRLPRWPELTNWKWPDMPDQEWLESMLVKLNMNTSRMSEKPLHQLNQLKKYYESQPGLEKILTMKTNQIRVTENRRSSNSKFKLALCIPKACTTQEGLNRLYLNTKAVGLQYKDQFCRLPNDKPWVAADYVFIAVFSLLGAIVLLSTSYDVRHTIFLGKDPKEANKLFQSFSVYTNTRRLVTYTPTPGALECLDGIRTFAMMWVIVSHTFVTQMFGVVANPLDFMEWSRAPRAIWITTASVTVDTFFMLSGLLLVYTTAGKITSIKLMRNLHLFYLHRLLRIFPVLAATVLMQASLCHWILDGPYWEPVEVNTNRCRVYWWSTLLHIQNYVNPSEICLGHSWYLAIDVQLHILSPIVLFWILSGKKRPAWAALLTGLILSISAATVYNFMMDFPPGPLIPSRIDEHMYYFKNYYVNTLTRASPFFIGMICGYLLDLYKKKAVTISTACASILWLLTVTVMLLVAYTSYPIMQLDWNNQLVDNMINSFMRPAWAACIAWLVFACVHGYGGPVNWVLSLRAWKLLGRLSYAMYMVHAPLMLIVDFTALMPVYFSVSKSLFKFLFYFTMTAIVSFILTLFVDSPFSSLIKIALPGPKRPGDLTNETNSFTPKPMLGAINRAYLFDEMKTRL